ncbi:MAG: FxSxx-COOH system tetratricopeptide repeat protein, partial [Trebonia sp.]
MSDILNGNRIKIPEWRFIQEFVAACRAAAAENRLDEDQLGTIADWHRHWQDAANGVIGARFPGHNAGSPGAATPGAEATHPQPEDPSTTAASPTLWGPAPPRLPDFTGRNAWLTALREAFTRKERVGAIAVQGLPGVGKTQLAIEYTHRYAREYDLVWWVQINGKQATRIDTFRSPEPPSRWLLVFDNADDPESIKDLIPPLHGDVLVTTRSTRWEAFGELVELDVFDRAESIEFLRRRLPKIPEAVAQQLADGVGDLPLLLEHAAGSHIPIAAYLARLNDDPLALLDGHPADYHSAIGQVWRTAVDQLSAEAPHAFDLLCCLSAFGPEPIPRDALERGGFLEDVSIHNLLRNPIQLAGAIRSLRRTGLLRISLSTRSLALHQVTRYIVRDLITGLTAAERFRHDVHLLLAATDPRTPRDPTSWQRYEELHDHAIASGAAACQHEMVREFVVNLVRYLTASGDPNRAIVLADQAFTRLDADVREDVIAVPGSHLLLRVAKADALFAQGTRDARPEAFRLWDETLAEMRAVPDRWMTEIIGIEGMTGARHRISGRFAEAAAADGDDMGRHVIGFGHDDPRTFNVAGSVVADLSLSGATGEAAAAARDLYRNCLAFYGDAGHPAVLAARNLVGRCQWLAGDYGEAAATMAEVRRGYADDRLLDEDHPWRLMHETDYAIARRDTVPELADLRLLADEMYQVRRRCWQSLGAGHLQTLAATVVLGSILRRVEGRESEAKNLIHDAERRYRSVLPGHPYAHACGVYLAVVCPDDQPVRAILEMTDRLAD